MNADKRIDIILRNADSIAFSDLRNGAATRPGANCGSHYIVLSLVKNAQIRTDLRMKVFSRLR
jgi:hypothetical protein